MHHWQAFTLHSLARMLAQGIKALKVRSCPCASCILHVGIFGSVWQGHKGNVRLYCSKESRVCAVVADIQNDILWRDTEGNVIQVCASQECVPHAAVNYAPRVLFPNCSTLALFFTSRHMAGLSCFMRVSTTCMGSTKEVALCHLARELLILVFPLPVASIFLNPLKDRKDPLCRKLLDAAEEHRCEAGPICLQEHTASGTAALMPVWCLCRGKPPSIVHRVDVIGVSCYTSTDLINWKYEGVSPHSAASASIYCTSMRTGGMWHCR